VDLYYDHHKLIIVTSNNVYSTIYLCIFTAGNIQVCRRHRHVLVHLLSPQNVCKQSSRRDNCARARRSCLAGVGKHFRRNNEASTAVSLDIGRPTYYYYYFIVLILLTSYIFLCYFVHSARGSGLDDRF